MSAAGTMASMIGRLHHLILDCSDPLALATFYSELLGQPITYRSDDFVVVAQNDTTSAWPSSSRPTTSRRTGRTRPGRSRCTST
jgi:hypothetical protein